MANAGKDVVYHNTGREQAEKLGAAINQNPNQSVEEFRREIRSGNATEQKAMWDQILKTNRAGGTDNSHLPNGFSIAGDTGHHVVKENGKVVYDEAKVSKQAEKDAQIHSGEGPYQALRRQGMTHQEAMAAAKDIKDTSGKSDKGFKAGESQQQEEDGKGSWHQYDRKRAEAKGLAAVDAEGKKIDQEEDAVDHALKDNGGYYGKMSLAQINYRLAPDMRGIDNLRPDQRQALEKMRDNFNEMSGGGSAITEESLKAYYAKKRSQNFG